MKTRTHLKKEDVAHSAKLANVPLTIEELETFAIELDETLGTIAMLDEVATTSVKPTSQVTGLQTVLRDDVPMPSLAHKDVFKNAKSLQNNFFKVSAVLEQR